MKAARRDNGSRRRPSDLALLLLPVAIWASLVVVGVKVMPDIRPVSLACASWAIAAVTLLSVKQRELRGCGRILRREAVMLLFCGLTGRSGSGGSSVLHPQEDTISGFLFHVFERVR